MRASSVAVTVTATQHGRRAAAKTLPGRAPSDEGAHGNVRGDVQLQRLRSRLRARTAGAFAIGATRIQCRGGRWRSQAIDRAAETAAPAGATSLRTTARQHGNDRPRLPAMPARYRAGPGGRLERDAVGQVDDPRTRRARRAHRKTGLRRAARSRTRSTDCPIVRTRPWRHAQTCGLTYWTVGIPCAFTARHSAS
jgi:hypothetical protein